MCAVGQCKGVFHEADSALAGDVLEHDHATFAATAGHDVDVAIAVQVHGPCVLRNAEGAEFHLSPPRGRQRIAHHLKQRHRRLPSVVAFFWVLRPLVRGGYLEPAVAVEVGEKDAQPGTPPLGSRQDQVRPSALPRDRAGILEIDEMREFRCHHHIGPPIAVHVANGCILRCSGKRSLGQRHVVPFMRAGAAESDAHVPVGLAVVAGVGFMHGDDILMSVAVKISHHQSVAATYGGAALGVVDPVLAPTDGFLANPGA